MYVLVDLEGRAFEYHVGDVKYPDIPLEEISYIQVDCTELGRVLEIFGTTIPVPNQGVAHWAGCFAKTIHLAMTNYKGFGL